MVNMDGNSTDSLFGVVSFSISGYEVSIVTSVDPEFESLSQFSGDHAACRAIVDTHRVGGSVVD